MHYSTPPRATLAAPISTTPSDPVFMHGFARVRALAKDIGEAVGTEVAQAVLKAAVTAFWHALFPAHTPRAPFWSAKTADLPDEIDNLCTGIGSAAAFLLRKRLAEEASPVTIDFLVERKGVYDTAQQETLLATWRRGHRPNGIKLSEVQMAEGQLRVQEIGTGRLPPCFTDPWALPRRVAHACVAPALYHSAHRLEDWGYGVRTGPVDGSGLKSRANATPAPGRVPLIWADAVDPAGGLAWPGPRRGSAAWFDVGKEDLLRQPAILVQRTTAPEQPRRLVTCLLSHAFTETHGAVGVENHLNLIEPIDGTSAVPLEVVAALLKSRVADMVLRCLSGSIAISATELRALPLPHRDDLAPLCSLVSEGAPDLEIERECARLYVIPQADAMLGELLVRGE